MKSKERIEEAKTLAIFRGGKCLSDSSIGGNKKLLWCCSKGHEWTSTLCCLKVGAWCPKCAKVARLTYSDILKQAADNNGYLVSQPDEFVNNRSHLIWKCNKGHEWKASYSNISRGT